MPSVLAVCARASLGTILRWKIGVALNALFPEIPPGTWLANMLGGYLIGVAIAFFISIAPWTRVASAGDYGLP